MKNVGYIITESAYTVSEDFKIVSEDVKSDSGYSSKRRVIGEGILQTADEKNRNGRWYSKTELFPQLTSPRTMELLNAGYLRAENGHPLSKELSRQQTIDGKVCCAKFLKLWTEGDNVCGRFCGTNNSLGDEFDLDLRDGCKPAWSLRALGTIENTRNGAEVKNLKLITYDQVIFPSHTKAYTRGLVAESAGMIDENYNGEFEHKGIIVPITNESVINYIKAESANFHMIKESFDLLYSDICLIENNSKVQLSDKNGNVIIVNLENYIHNEIMNYCTGDR